ncbi:chitobiase/beta-hexosaminidase C-terminal domain-containing protein [Anaerosporobacter sp.]|uniref:chitobiase/beta-hexosaminidase C-terminal domain-containing protein n=1 Tax=Anaerosporobacter sp. TaxID=1872529 RepID=UPI00286F9A4D|nr:chitobiase/beta-hexosaminidase C-terminal domain-containing protein [Anaerosporobacter sp.]
MKGKKTYGLLRRGMALVLSLAMTTNAMGTWNGSNVVKAATADERVMFSDFELPFNGLSAGNQLVKDDEKQTVLKYITTSGGGSDEVTVKSVNQEAVDVTGMTKFVITIKDTQGENTIRVKVDNKADVWSSDKGVQGEWCEIEIALKDLNVENNQVSQIKIYEWNKGTYFIDDIYFSNDDGTQTVLFQDFEKSLTINDSTAGKITQDEKKSGNTSLLYKKNGGDIQVTLPDADGVDATGKEYLVIWIKDTHGDNNFELQLTDANGGTSKSGYWTTAQSVKNQWAPIVVPMTELTDSSSLDISKIVKVKIWEYNDGNYYIDDIYFTNAVPPSAPTFSDAEGNYGEAFDLTLSAEIGADIYYTTDGSVPTENSQLYVGAISIATTTTVKAIAIKDGESSATVTATFTIRPNDLPAKTFLSDFEQETAQMVNATITAEDKYNGEKSAAYVVGSSASPNEESSFYVEVANSVDAKYYDYFVFWMKDTQGSNTVMLQFVDEDDNMTNWAWYDNSSSKTGKTVKNEWVEYAIPMSKIQQKENVDLTRIKGVRIGQWNSGTYYIDDVYFTNTLAPKTPVANYNSGTYAELTDITLTTTNTDCQIYYTTDGTEPTVNSTLYTTPFAITNDTTVKAITARSADDMSGVAVYNYRIKALPASGEVSFQTFENGLAQVKNAYGVKYSLDADSVEGSNALMCNMYTVSGNPSEKVRSVFLQLADDETVDIRKSNYLTVFVKDYQNYNTPTVFVKDMFGTVVSGKVATATVYGEWTKCYIYLDDLDSKKELDRAYISEVGIGFNNTGTYVIDDISFSEYVYGIAGTVTANEVVTSTATDKEYVGSCAIELFAEDGAEIYYTTNGKEPTKNSDLYTKAISITKTATIKAIAVKDDVSSSVYDFSYVVKPGKVVATHGAAGTYDDFAVVELGSTSGATIYYTVDGSEPDKTKTVYNKKAFRVDESKTVKAIAYNSDGSASEVTTLAYVINKTAQEPAGNDEQVTISNFLQADGKVIRNNYGKGDEVVLRGTNAGGWLVTEDWQCPVDGKDFVTIIKTLTERFGKETAEELIEVYQDNWWTEKDFDLVKEEGMNVLRLPVTYFEMTNADGTLSEDAFEKLDWFIEQAKKRDIYVMIDMHGAFGSQNGKDHSGDITIADIGQFYGEEENIQKTIRLWEAIATRYKDEPIVCGYDLLNEPSTSGTMQYDVYDRLYRAIRAIDKKHMIFMQAIWEPTDLPDPALYGWENVVYQYHFYQWNDLNSLNSQTSFINNKVSLINESTNYDVPVFVGEFTFFANTESWKQCLDIFEREGWSYTTWTFKVSDGGEGSSWGIYTKKSNTVNIKTDSVETIRSKWSEVTTDTFVRNTEIADILKGCFANNSEMKVPYEEEPQNNGGDNGNNNNNSNNASNETKQSDDVEDDTKEQEIVVPADIKELANKSKAALSIKTLYVSGNKDTTAKVKLSIPEGLNQVVRFSDNGIKTNEVIVTYTSKNTKIATVSKTGKITAKKAGKTTIVVTFELRDGTKITKNCAIEVKKATMTLAKKVASMKVGKQQTIKVNCVGYDASKITWKSSNSSIVTVGTNKGKTQVKITAKKKGTANIIIYCAGKKVKTIKITVK